MSEQSGRVGARRAGYGGGPCMGHDALAEPRSGSEFDCRSLAASEVLILLLGRSTSPS